MFNLDQAILDWRRQMLAEGIKTPVPLEELESHLREEIEQHIKSGLNEEEAFQAAVEKIGRADQLQKEFKKVEKNHKVMRAFLLISWLAASCALAFSVDMWELDWNFFHFSPKWDLGLIYAMLGVLVSLMATWFLAKANRDKLNGAVSFFLCVILAGTAVWILHADENATGILGGHYKIPLWYRASRTLLLCVPGVFWVWWTRYHLTQKCSPTHGNLPIHTD